MIQFIKCWPLFTAVKKAARHVRHHHAHRIGRALKHTGGIAASKPAAVAARLGAKASFWAARGAPVTSNLLREAAALIRDLDEAFANVVSITMPAHASEWARPALAAAAARHAARTKAAP